MRDVLEELLSWPESGQPLAIATVVETWGSSPRPAGSRMLVSADGRIAGSVSNGCVEGAVYDEAQRVIKSGLPRLIEYGVADELAFEVGLACGGHLEVFVQPMLEAHRELAELVRSETPVVARTNLESGDVQLQRVVPDEDRAFRHDNWFVEPFSRPPHMVVVGAIHIAVPLHRFAKMLGYRVTIVDARAKFATRERFPDADDIVVAWPDDALGSLPIDRLTALVILTHDPKFDLPALRAALRSSAFYVGAIGSRKTNEGRFTALRHEGFAEAEIQRVHGPIGLDLGGRSAEETALAIIAEVTAARNSASGAEMREVKAARA